jgi:hypothetical protein
VGSFFTSRPAIADISVAVSRHCGRVLAAQIGRREQVSDPHPFSFSVRRDLVRPVGLGQQHPHALVERGRDVLADVVGPDRQLAVAAVDETASCTWRGRPRSARASRAARMVRPEKSTSSTRITRCPSTPAGGRSVRPSARAPRSRRSSR